MNKTVSHSVLATTGDSVDMPELAERLKNTSVSVIKEMMYLGALEQNKGKDVTSLGVGLPFYPAPDFIHQHAINVLKNKKDIDKYTLLTGLPELRKIVATLSQNLLGIETSPDDILITPGSMAGLFYSMLTLVNPGDEVILPSPYFSSNGEQVSIAGGKPIPVPMIEDKIMGYRLDIDKIRKAISNKTKAIILNNPQNPTGAVFLEEDLRKLADILSLTKIYVITDEVYDFLVYDDYSYFNIATIKKLWPRVIRCCSLSKKYGMMGWRIGYLHTNKKLLMNILKIHDANIVCAPHISQEAAIAALTGPQDVVKDHKNWLKQNRELICERLDRLADLFSYIKPRGTYYVFPRFNLPIKSIEFAKKLLYEAGVVTIPGVGFGPDGEYHLRLSFGSSPDEISKSFDKIETWWKSNKKNLKLWKKN